MMDELIKFWQNLSPQAKEDITRGILLVFIGAVITLLLQHLVWPLIKATGKKLIEWMYPQLAGGVFNRWAVQRYQVSLKEQVGKLSHPWIPEELEQLTEIYVPVQLQKVVTLAEQENSPSSENTKISTTDVFKKYKRFVIIGGPGAGKSTIMQSLAFDCLTGRLSFRSEKRKFWQWLVELPGLPIQILPVILDLKELGKSEYTLLDSIIEQFERHDFPNARFFVERKLKRGELLLLFDGLDEVSEENRPKMVKRLIEFLSFKSYVHNPAVVTCRSASYKGELYSVMRLTLGVSEFTARQIDLFLRKWSYPPGKGPRNLKEILIGISSNGSSQNQESNKTGLFQLARNPLMLTILTYFYIKGKQLPKSKVEFYDECANEFLESWHIRKNVLINKYDSSVKKLILQKLAYFNQYQGREDCSEPEANILVADILIKTSYRPEEAKDILREIALNSGLIVLTKLDNYRFTHLTFQEYFTAREIYNSRRPDELCAQLMRNPGYWREVLLLYCELADLPSRNEMIGDLLDIEEVELAALAMAHGKAVDTRLSTRVINSLKRQIARRADSKLLEALAFLSTNERLSYSDEALKFLEAQFDNGNAERKKKILKALSKVGNVRSVKILVNSLGLPGGIREAALDALSILGEAAITPFEQGLASKNFEIVRICIEAWLEVESPYLTLPIITQLNNEVDAETRYYIAFGLGEKLKEWAVGKKKDFLIQGVRFESMFKDNLGDWTWPSRILPGREIHQLVNTIISVLTLDIQNQSRWQHRYDDYVRLLPLFILVPLTLEVKHRNEQSNRRWAKVFLDVVPFGEMLRSHSFNLLHVSWAKLLDDLKPEKEPFKIPINFSFIGIVLLFILFSIPNILIIGTQVNIPFVIGGITLVHDISGFLPFITLVFYLTYIWVFFQNQKNRSLEISSWFDNLLLFVLSPLSFVLSLLSLDIVRMMGHLFISILVWLPIYVLGSLLSPLFFPPVTIGICFILVLATELLVGIGTKTIKSSSPFTSNKQENLWINWLRHSPDRLREVEEFQEAIIAVS